MQWLTFVIVFTWMDETVGTKSKLAEMAMDLVWRTATHDYFLWSFKNQREWQAFEALCQSWQTRFSGMNEESAAFTIIFLSRRGYAFRTYVLVHNNLACGSTIEAI